MSVTASIRGLVEQVGTAKLRESIDMFCARMSQEGKVVLGGAAMGLAGQASEPWFLIAIVASGAALQVAGMRGQQDQQQRSQQDLLKEFSTRIKACGDDPERVAGVVAEAAGKDNPLLVRLAGYDRADL
ncbi:hypothetical protein MNBD_PLANCTO03-402, partial [hydrothermal vent metagenome]